MKLTIGKKANVNYLAKIVRINQFKPHTDPEVTRLKACVVDGFNILCGIDSEPGLYVYFPTACCLNPDFLRNDIDVNELPIEEIRKAVVELILQVEDKEELIWEWRSLMESVGHYEDLGHCDTCGDDISKYTVNIE